MVWSPFSNNNAAPQQQPVDNVNPPASQSEPLNKGVNPGGSDPTNQTTGTAPGSANNLPADQSNPNPPQSPLEIMEQAWQTKPNDKGDAPDLTLSASQELLDKVVPQLRLTDSIPAELMERVNNGDGSAMMEAINLVGQTTYKSAMQHAMTLVNHNLEARQSTLPELINSQVQSSLTNQAVTSGDMPNANNPTVKRELQRVAQQFRDANPSASPQDIAAATRNYFTELQTAMTQAPASQQPQVNDSEWESWLDS